MESSPEGLEAAFPSSIDCSSAHRLTCPFEHVPCHFVHSMNQLETPAASARGGVSEGAGKAEDLLMCLSTGTHHLAVGAHGPWALFGAGGVRSGLALVRMIPRCALVVEEDMYASCVVSCFIQSRVWFSSAVLSPLVEVRDLSLRKLLIALRSKPRAIV